MCVFDPDDQYLLCSGVDTRLRQYEVSTWEESPTRFPLRPPMHHERYRRATYLAGGRYIATAATEESHMHLLTVEGASLGVLDFKGVLDMMPQASLLTAAMKRRTLNGRRQRLVSGTVRLNDEESLGSSDHEFVQSVRTHPMIKHRIGVLLSRTQSDQSYVAMVDIDPNYLEN